MASHEAHIERQFGAVATAYLSSSVHAQGEDLIAVGSRLQGRSGASVLDLGCGAGHLSFAMAPNVHNVTAYDLSRDMLSMVAEEAKRRGLDNISIKQGSAEALPFSDASFDYVCTRYSAHHWTNIHVALREIRRVLKPDGAVIIIDVCAPEAPLLDTHLQSVELLRDRSHARDYSVTEWRRLLSSVGFDIHKQTTWKLRMEFASWVGRMQTPVVYVEAIRSLLQDAPQEVRDYFQITADCSFTIDAAMIECAL